MPRGLLLESDMLTAISAHQLRYEILDHSLVVLDFALERTRRQSGISQRQGAFPSPGAKALMDEIRQVVKESADIVSITTRSDDIGDTFGASNLCSGPRGRHESDRQ